jgi:hypothetical protein
MLTLVGGISPLVHAKDDVCGIRYVRGGTVFSLGIGRSRVLENSYVQFKLCQRPGPSKSFLLIHTETEQPKKHSETRQLPIDEGTYSDLFGLYDRALDYDVKNDTMGFDGSSWCLETTRGFTYSKACFWSPDVETDTRHLTDMLALGRKLWHLAGMDADRLF